MNLKICRQQDNMKIIIGIPTTRQHEGFIKSMENFIPIVKDKYCVEFVVVEDMPIADARNEIVDNFLSRDADYLLFLDDDHEGHTLEMLESLIKANEYVCAIKCYSRGLPHDCTLMDYSGLRLESRMGRYVSKDNTSGYHYCDLVGFGMTLIKKETFSKLEKPYFVSVDNQFEDNYFCDNLRKIGIKPMGCFDHVLSHNGINESNAKSLTKKFMDDLRQKVEMQYPECKGKDMSLIM